MSGMNETPPQGAQRPAASPNKQTQSFFARSSAMKRLNLLICSACSIKKKINLFSFLFRHAQSPLGLLLIALLLLGRFAPSFDSIKRRELASQKKATNPHATTATNKEREPNPLSLFGLLAG